MMILVEWPAVRVDVSGARVAYSSKGSHSQRRFSKEVRGRLPELLTPLGWRHELETFDAEFKGKFGASRWHVWPIWAQCGRRGPGTPLTEQISHRYTERISKPLDDRDRRIASAAFDVADIGAMKTRDVGERLLT